MEGRELSDLPCLSQALRKEEHVLEAEGKEGSNNKGVGLARLDQVIRLDY